MARRLILDTGVLVKVELGAAGLDDLIAESDDVALATITAAELLVGVELADEARRQMRSEFLEALLAAVPVEEYTLDVARAHAKLLANVRGSGKPRGAFDLIIAATALATGRTVVTADAAACFHHLPGVEMELLSA